MSREKAQKGRADASTAPLGGSRREAGAGDLGPGREGLGSGNSVVGDRTVVSVEVEEVGDGTVDREETLNLAR